MPNTKTKKLGVTGSLTIKRGHGGSSGLLFIGRCQKEKTVRRHLFYLWDFFWTHTFRQAGSSHVSMNLQIELTFK